MTTYYFDPPLKAQNSPYLPDTTGPALRLARHRKGSWFPVNVFLLSDGTYTDDWHQPPYPWNPDDPGGAYSYSKLVGGVAQEAKLAVYIVKVYYGGHHNEITAAEAASLTAAGYGANITTV